MKVQSASSQANEITQVQTAQNQERGAASVAADALIDTSELKPSGELHVGPAVSGVGRDARGQAFIRQGAQAFPVRYDKDNGTWHVFSPENPAKYQYPVRQDSNGIWHTTATSGCGED